MKMKIKDLTLMSVLLTILIISSKIVINISFVPLTFQTFAVMITSMILKTKKAAIVFAIYTIIGLFGLPVFSSGGGFEYIFKPSFGFILGFIMSSLFIGNVNTLNSYFKNIILITIGLTTIYLVGSIYMYIIFNCYLNITKDILEVLIIGVIPFIIKDFSSSLLSLIIYRKLIKQTSLNNYLLCD